MTILLIVNALTLVVWSWCLSRLLHSVHIERSSHSTALDQAELRQTDTEGMFLEKAA